MSKETLNKWTLKDLDELVEQVNKMERKDYACQLLIETLAKKIKDKTIMQNIVDYLMELERIIKPHDGEKI